MAVDPLALALSVLLQSVEATDRLQTEHWIKGTKTAPLTTPSGEGVYEANPVLAGRPGEREEYFDFWEAAAAQAPQSEFADTPLGKAALAAWAIGQTGLVVKNNETARRLGLPEHWMLMFRKRF